MKTLFQNRNRYKFAALLIAMITAMPFAWSQPGGGPPGGPGGGQPPQHMGEKQEQMEQLKIAFITKQLDLTSEEAQLFWPVYNDYQDKLQEIRDDMRLNVEETKLKFDDLSDKELETAMDQQHDLQQKELSMRVEMTEKMKEVLPIRKVALLHNAEHEFKRYLFDLLQNKKGGPGPKGGGSGKP